MRKKLTSKAKIKRSEPRTPDYIIKRALRNLWLRSRERLAALKSTGYCCGRCGVKRSASKANPVKIEVHHREGVGNWQAVYEIIRQEILCDPGWLEPLCEECHKDADKERGKRNERK